MIQEQLQSEEESIKMSAVIPVEQYSVSRGTDGSYGLRSEALLFSTKHHHKVNAMLVLPFGRQYIPSFWQANYISPKAMASNLSCRAL